MVNGLKQKTKDNHMWDALNVKGRQDANAKDKLAFKKTGRLKGERLHRSLFHGVAENTGEANGTRGTGKGCAFPTGLPFWSTDT